MPLDLRFGPRPDRAWWAELLAAALWFAGLLAAGLLLAIVVLCD